jgi:tetratricopeptide (TPR) repeat protein
LEDCESAIGIDSTYFKAWYRKALALVSLERPKEAKEVLESAKAIGKDNEMATALLAVI